MIQKQWTRPASSGQGQIFSQLWAHEQPKAVLLIAHGMAEHSGRYGEFAAFLAQQGWAVFMNDHAGHGRSALVQGHFADRDGWQYVLEDLRALEADARAACPGLPVFLMGHSMGSFLARAYIARWGAGLAGAIVCGTMGANPLLGAARALAAVQAAVLGPQSRGRLIEALSTGSYHKQFKGEASPSAWLSSDEAVCLAFDAAPDCGFTFTAAAYRDLFGGLHAVTGPAWAQQVPKTLPVFVVAGDADPVGANGKGPAQVYGWLQAAGLTDVQLKLYPGMRHEILNEKDRRQVFGDLAAWLHARLPAAV